MSFWRFSQKVSILEYMLLHNSYIKMAIADILVGRKSLYDLHSPKWKSQAMQKRAWPFGQVPHQISIVSWSKPVL